MRRNKKPPELDHVKHVRSKGRYYSYFRTGTFRASGTEILAKLPPFGDPGFMTSYASYLAGRTRRTNVARQLGIRQLVDQFLDSPEFDEFAAGTRKTYAVYLRVIGERLHPAPAAQVERADVLKLRDAVMDEARAKGLRGTGAANGLKRTVQALYKWARDRELVGVDVDPAKRIKVFASEDHEPWPVELLSAALVDPDPEIRLPVAIMYYTALRIGDACSIRWDALAVDAAAGRRILTAHPQKGRRRRQEIAIPIHSDLESELGMVRKKGLTIITDKHGRPIDADDVLRPRLQAWAAARGFKVVPHGLRKNAVNALLEAGCSVAETASISGQSLALVEHYAKRRNTRKLGNAAILNWERAKS
jgi:integrase